MITEEQLVARWSVWLDRLAKELVQLHQNRELFTDLRDAMVRKDPEAPATWLHHYAYVYVHSQVIGIRKVVRGDSKSVSLTRLVGDLQKNEEVLTSTRHLAAKTLHGMLSQLMGDLKSVITWADERAAHMLEQPPGVSITFADVHNAIDRVTATFNELSMLVTNKTWHFPAALTRAETSLPPTDFRAVPARPVVEKRRIGQSPPARECRHHDRCPRSGRPARVRHFKCALTAPPVRGLSLGHAVR